MSSSTNGMYVSLFFPPDNSRKNIFLSLLVTSVLGTLSFLLLRKRQQEEMLSEEEGQLLLSNRTMSVKH